jgi:predicted nucleic acid-binding protein
MGASDYLLDTSACSKYIQELLSNKAADLMDIAIEPRDSLSVITRIELLSWVTGSNRLDSDIRAFIAESEIFELTEPVIQQTVRLRRHYKRLNLPDAIIAATAIAHNLTLLSTNDNDFSNIRD